ncbi:MAG: hypothetical protein L7V86_04830 [Verrucomicrobiales bacterium]|jgi:hypothetical protein|nr:hypothetical protein [Verrucomicrobiales bacterium]
MKATLLMLLLIPAMGFAIEERSLGVSPDKNFELLLRAETPEDYGLVSIKNISTSETIDTMTGQGYSYFRTDDVEAVWKEDSTAFAVSVRGTKTTRSTDVYIRDGERWRKLVLPPYIPNILGRQGVISTGRNVYEDFGGFEGSRRFNIICHVEPDWQQKELADKVTDWKPSDQTEWKVALEYHLSTSPNCRILSIEPWTEPNSEQTGAVRPLSR